MDKVTGRRLYIQVLGWDFAEYRPHNWGNTQNSASKKWSKKVRRYLEREVSKELKYCL